MLWSLAFRGVALVQIVALSSLLPQLSAFGGTRGLQPVAVKLSKLRLHMGRRAWLSTPTLLWFSSSDFALHGVAVAGIAAALNACCGGVCAAASLLLANVAFLSYDVVVGLSMPWDCLLLEAGWIGALLPPPVQYELFDQAPVHPAAAWLVRWLLFRLMIGFGKLKFRGTTSADQLYVRDFMILQPMPSRLGWLAHCYVPTVAFRWLLKVMFFTEICAPWLLFLPTIPFIGDSAQPFRLAAFLFCALMAGIFAHGSFGHFNLLTIALALPLLAPGCPSLWSDDWPPLHTLQGICSAVALAFYIPAGLLHLPFSSGISRGFAYFPVIDRWPAAWKRGIMQALRIIQPFRLVHSYGVFPPRTAPPLKIIPCVEGSADGGKTWQRYMYRHMLSGAESPPRWCAPHQPRLDCERFTTTVSKHLPAILLRPSYYDHPCSLVFSLTFSPPRTRS